MGEKVNYECKFKDTSGYWIADNSEQLRNHLSFLSRQAKSVDCYDFETLYINIPREDFFNKTCCLLGIVFDERSMLIS